jgi:hypothetical protein
MLCLIGVNVAVQCSEEAAITAPIAFRIVALAVLR